MNNRQYDDLNQHDIQAILDNAAGVVREVDAGSTEYTPEQHQHAQDVQRDLADTLASRPPIVMDNSGAPDFVSGTLIN